LNDAPADSNLYARYNNAWQSFTAGQGPQGDQGPQGNQGDQGPQGDPGNPDLNGQTLTNGNINLGGMWTCQAPTLTDGYIHISMGTITFGDNSAQSSAGIPDPPANGQYWVRINNNWTQGTVVSIYNQNDGQSYNCLTVPGL
jgi:hypothetical protein